MKKKLPELVVIAGHTKGLCAPSYFNLTTGELKRTPATTHVCQKDQDVKHVCQALPEIHRKPPNCS